MRYAICHTPRTGSNLLVDLLTQTRLAGITDLYKGGFFIGSGDGVKEAYQNGAADRFFADNTTPNGVSGCKVGIKDFDDLDRVLPFGAVDTLLASFDRWLWLTRQDRLAQAISWYVARRTGIWTTEDAKRPRKVAQPVEYNYARIAAFLGRIQADNARAEAFFDLHGIVPLPLVYEDWSQDFEGTIKRVLKVLGVEDPAHKRVKPLLQRQRDPRKAEYYDRFREDYERVTGRLFDHLALDQPHRV